MPVSERNAANGRISYVALLRGVNVSGKNRIKMPELISALDGSGLERITTYLQSGNLVFQKDDSQPQEIAKVVENCIRQSLRLEVGVLVKNVNQMAEIAAGNPYLEVEGIEPEHLYVTFLFENPAESGIKNLEGLTDPLDSFKLIGGQVYLHCPQGYGRTRFSNNFFEKKLGVMATTRNWRTVMALKEMAQNLRVG